MLDKGWEFISPKNITLEAFIAIYFWSREGGGPSTNESNIVTHQENGQPLPQVADTLRILLANVSSQRTPQPGDVSRAIGCQPPRVSTAKGMKVIPSLAHLSSYYLNIPSYYLISQSISDHIL